MPKANLTPDPKLYNRRDTHPACRQLAAKLRLPLVDKDDARDAFQALAQQAGPAGVDWNGLSYSVMFAVAATQLSLGLGVVLDCPLARLELYRTALELAQQVGAGV